jgi:hypothetical protein
MRLVSIFSIGAFCAILAGASRAALIVAPMRGLSTPALESVYLAIDLAILLTLFALAARLGNQLGLVGLLGLVLAVTGLLVIRTGERSLFGVTAYSSGAGLLAIGMAVITIPFLRFRGFGSVAAALFILSPVVAIIGSTLNIGTAASRIASAIFSLALIAAGGMLALSRSAGGT